MLNQTIFIMIYNFGKFSRLKYTINKLLNFRKVKSENKPDVARKACHLLL